MYKLSLRTLRGFAAPRLLLLSAAVGSEVGGRARRARPHSVIVLVVVFALLDAIAVLLLLVLLLRVGDVPLRVIVQHGLGFVDLQLRGEVLTLHNTILDHVTRKTTTQSL